jgi:PAS domain S-box-containing protein
MQQERVMHDDQPSGRSGIQRVPIEQALKEAVELAEMALAASNMGVWSLDTATQVLTLDARARAIWALQGGAGTCSASELEQLVHPQDRARRQILRQKALDPAGDGQLDLDYRIAAREGYAERWVAVRGQTTFSQGHADRMIGTVRDITARKSAKQRLRASEEQLLLSKAALEAQIIERTHQLEAMHDAAVNAILTIDPGGFIQSINAATTHLLGYVREELLGQNVRMIMPEPYAREHDGYLKSYLTTGAKKIIGIGREVTARRKDGSTFPIHLSVSEFEANGKRFFTGIITDLSERTAAELALRETERQLAQAQKMEAVGQLTGGLAHDFNNLLTVITGNLELLDMRLENEADRDLVRRADEAARMGARLTGRLLTFSRRRALQPTIVNLNDTTVGMTELLRRSLGESITVTSELAPDLWTTHVDAGEIENAILNLAINARDAMPNGGRILIETSNAALPQDDLLHASEAIPGDYVKLTVSDQGTGMTPQVVARAFEPFFTTKEAGRGTGLGLSTIYGFVRQSGGHANITSEVGKGTAVSLYLPRDTSAAAPETRPASTPAITSGVGETVLVVEDNEQVRDLTVRRLQALGYVILVTGNGPSAIALLEQRTDIDLVFSDVVMPGGLSGFDVVAWIKQHRPHVRVLLTSGFAPEMADGGAAVAADIQLLRKPYKHTDLARAVREALRK